MASYTISQGESLILDYTPSPSQDLTDFTCRVQVRNSEGVQGDEKFFTDTVNNNRTFTGQLTSAETNNLYVGTYTLGAEVFNTALGFNQEWCCELIITEQCVSPDVNGVIALVEFAEAQPTPETQEAAQTAVDSLPISQEKIDLQARVTALDPEVAKVEAARLAVEAAETYPWTAVKQSDAQALVDDLVSTIEQAALTARLDALDDKVTAETATTLAEYTTLADDVAAAQVDIFALDPVDQPLLQDRLNAIYVPARWEEANPSEFALVETPWIDGGGFGVRSPNFRVSQKLDRSIAPSSGWASVHLTMGATDPLDRTLNSFYGIGDLVAMSNGGFQDLLPPDQDKAVTAGNAIYFDGTQRAGNIVDVILVLDYRTATPHVYFIDVLTQTLSFDTPLNYFGDVDLFARCENNSAIEREWFYNVNTGIDLVNNPFPIDAEAVLIGEGVDTTGYVIGWGSNGSRDVNTGTTTLTITGITPPVPTLGDTVTVTASVIDAYGVDRSADVVWYNKFFNWYNTESVQTGSSMTCTPETYGYYEGVAEYTDTNGNKVTETYLINIEGDVPETGATQFDVARSHVNINAISANQVRFGTAVPFKLAALSNNPMRGRFCYVEFELLTLDVASQFGFGITSILNGKPFARDESIMWSGIVDGLYPQDGAGAGTYLEAFSQDGFLDMPFVNGQNLIGFPPQPSNSDRFNTAFYHGGVNGSQTAYLGMAVDYRNEDQAPLVYAFHQEFGTGIDKVVGAFRVNNSRSPVVPTIYCNNGSFETVNFDCAINGGSFGAFAIDPRPLLLAAGVDISEFEYGWTTAEVQP